MWKYRWCQKCKGQCCRVVKIAVQPMAADQQRWAEMRGTIKNGRWRINSTCRHLDDEGKCSIYETRPKVCRDFAVGGPECVECRKMAKEDKDGKAQDSKEETVLHAGARHKR